MSQNKTEEVKKILDESVVCTDGLTHCIDENHKRYLSGQICQLFESKHKLDRPDREKIIGILSPGMLRSGDALNGKGELVEKDSYLFITKEYKSRIVDQILALIPEEPKPSKEQIVGHGGEALERTDNIKLVDGLAIFDEPKPDESRLLTEEEISNHCYKLSTSPKPFAFTPDDGTLVSPNSYTHVRINELTKAQDAKTAPIAYKQGYDDACKVKDAECRQRIEGIEL